MADNPLIPLGFCSDAPLARPLSGLTLLLVEDSRVSAEALRLICQRSGARLRRADTLQAARRHLGVYMPSAVLVDIGLPDGSGLELIAELACARGTAPALIATSADEGAEATARAAGANGFLAKPVDGIAGLCAALIEALPESLVTPAIKAAATLRRVGQTRPLADPAALFDDLSAAEELLRSTENNPVQAAYLAQFLGSIARSCGDTALDEAARALALRPGAPDAADHLASLMAKRRATAAL